LNQIVMAMAFAPPPANNVGVAIPAIPADPPSLTDITNTKEYVERLVLSKASRAQVYATDDEIGAAELYHHNTVLRTSIRGEVDGPIWLQELVDNLRQTRETVQRIEQRLDEVANTVNEVVSTVRRTSVVIENMRIAKSNVELARIGTTSYHAKQKEVEGDGTIAANNILPNIQQQLAPLAAAAVGTVFSPTIDTHNLNHQVVLRMVQYYNQNFDIQAGDIMPVRSQKVANWLTSNI